MINMLCTGFIPKIKLFAGFCTETVFYPLISINIDRHFIRMKVILFYFINFSTTDVEIIQYKYDKNNQGPIPLISIKRFTFVIILIFF